MGNPTSGCTVQAPMSLSRRRHRPSLSLQLEQLGSIHGDKKKSASALSSPKGATEEKSIASFLGGKQVTRTKPSSLSGTEDCLKRIEHTGRLSSSDRKPTSFNPFRGHRRVGSGNVVTSCKPLEKSPVEKKRSSSFRMDKYSTEKSPGEKGRSSSFRMDKFYSTEKSPGEKGRSSSFRIDKYSSEKLQVEKGRSLSFRMDKYSVAKIAASLFHSPSKIERSMSMSRVAHKPEEVISLRQKFQAASDDGSQMSTRISGGKKSRSDSMAKDMEDSAVLLISNASSLQQHFIGITNTLFNNEGEAESPTTAYEDPLPFTEDDPKLHSVHSQMFVNAAERMPSNLTSTSPSDPSRPPSCLIELNPRGWTIKSSQSDASPTTRIPSSSEKCSSESVSEPCADPAGVSTPILISRSQSTYMDASPQDVLSLEASKPSSLSSLSAQSSFHLEPERTLDLPLEADSPEHLHALIFATEKVTEAELTEAAVRSSLKRDDYPPGPILTSEESQQTPFTSFNAEKGLQLNQISSPILQKEISVKATCCKSDACLTKSVSFEPGSGAERKPKLRKRRRSVSASGIGAMLLKVVRVSDSGPMVTRRLPKVGPAEIISGAEALRAREYVLQKTAQISMGRAHESFSGRASAASVCQCDQSEDAVKFIDIELESGGGFFEHVQHSKDAFAGVDGTGIAAASTREGRKRNQHTTSERPSEYVIPRHLPDLGTAKAENTCTLVGMTPTLKYVESSFHERVERVDSNLQRPTADGKFDSQTKSANTSAAAYSGNIDEKRGGKPRRKNSRGRNSYDFDSVTECLKTSNSNNGLGEQTTTNKQGQYLLDANTAITRERSRSFVSRLQAQPGMASADTYRLAPSSISILANPSFSSSHQDRLWEEQADIYSSGGRGTPGREDEPASANVFLHSSSPGNAISSDDHQVPSASGSLRRGLIDSTVKNPSAVTGEKERRKKGKKRGRPRTPLRSLLSDDVHSKRLGSGSTSSPERGHFFQQIMSKIRGSSSKSSSPKSRDGMSKRRYIWSSCICFSIK